MTFYVIINLKISMKNCIVYFIIINIPIAFL